MKSKLTMNDLTQIKKQAEDISSNRNENNSVFEHCQLILINKLPNKTQTEAENIVYQLKEGIAMFYENYDDCTEKGYVDYAIAVAKVLEGKTDEERCNYYVNILLVTHLAEKKLEEVQSLTEEELKKIRVRIVGDKEIDRDVDALTIETLRNQALVALENNKLMSFELSPDMDLTNKNVDFDKIRKFLADEDNALYMAVAAYITQQNGELSLPNNMNAQMIGMAVAAGMKESEITTDLAEGKIDLPQWVGIMKIISGVLLYGVLLVSSVLLSAYLLFPILLFLLDILGVGLIAITVTFCIIMAVTCVLSDFLNDYVLDPIVETASNLYDISTEWLHKKYVEWKTSKETDTDVSTINEGRQQITEAETVSIPLVTV